mmetsp:Transcript_3472/g.14174  ORF Transcript_3472/g.14174 Transcript_3472/m.14174 type:complete len:345 (+) Transcript_3472:164-1198(+)
MAEVPVTGGEERDAVLVAAVDGVLVAHGAAGVCDSLDARLTSLLDGITPCEGKERIGREHRTLRFVPGLLQRDPHRVDPVRLPRTHAQEPALGGDGDGVGLDVLDDPPRELERLVLFVGGVRVGDDLEVDILGDEAIGGLLQPAAANLAEGGRRGPGIGLKDAKVLGLALEHFETLLGVRRGDDDLVEHAGLVVRRGPELAELLGHLLGQLAVERDDPAKRGDGIGADRLAVGLEDVPIAARRGRGAAGVGVLDDHAGGVGGWEVADARERRLGVEVVVVGHLFAVVLLGATDAHASRLGEGVVGVHSRGLMGILAVSQGLVERHGHAEFGGGLALADLAPEVL